MKTGHVFHSACITSVVGVVFCLYYHCISVQSKPQIVLTCSDYITTPTRQALLESIKAAIEASSDTTRLCFLLQKKFPGIFHFSCNRFIPGRLIFNISYDLPLAYIKTHYEEPQVLTRQGLYVPIQHYCEDMLHHLPVIVVTQQITHPADYDTLYTWVASLPHSFHERYYAQWESPFKIVIKDSHNPDYCYTTTAQKSFTPQHEQEIENIKSKLPLKKYKKWNIDMRFHDHFVAGGIK